MGEKDKTQKLLVGCKDVCAELLNVFVYDGMSYRRQYRKGEKTSVGNGQGIYPVISLVLNWGKRPWKAAKSLRELLDYPVPEQAESYLNDYKLHVFDMRFLDQSIREKFHGDMRVVLDYLADPESLLRSSQPLRHPEEVLRMLHALSGDKRYPDCITTAIAEKERA